MCYLYPFIMGEIVVISAHKISVFGGNVNVRSFLSIVLCFDNYNIFIFILYLKFHQKCENIFEVWRNINYFVQLGWANKCTFLCLSQGPVFPMHRCLFFFFFFFCVLWVRVRGHCLFCLCWWNCWPSLGFFS